MCSVNAIGVFLVMLCQVHELEVLLSVSAPLIEKGSGLPYFDVSFFIVHNLKGICQTLLSKTCF